MVKAKNRGGYTQGGKEKEIFLDSEGVIHTHTSAMGWDMGTGFSYAPN